MFFRSFKRNQKSIETNVTVIRKILEIVEAKVTNLDKTREEQLTTQRLFDTVRKENQILRSRLDDAEDRSRRNNVIFHDFEDFLYENWAKKRNKGFGQIIKFPWTANHGRKYRTCSSTGFIVYRKV